MSFIEFAAKVGIGERSAAGTKRIGWLRDQPIHVWASQHLRRPTFATKKLSAGANLNEQREYAASLPGLGFGVTSPPATRTAPPEILNLTRNLR